MAIVTPLPLGWRWEAGGMTHVVNLLPWRDLQVIHRRQPPLPADGDRYAIALGLALGGGRHDA
ncbi:hypothetical protein CQA67_12700, partial [Klebsiella pneumoniae]